MHVNIGSSVAVVLLTLLNVDLILADWNEPLSPSDYKTIIGQGFATNYFKSKKPLSKYNETNIKDVYDAGFRNLRLRCRADLDGLLPFTGERFTSFLEDLSTVVDDCLQNNVVPIISWIHHEYEANATLEGARTNYLGWWEEVAKHLKDKDYRLSFNLFTELGTDACDDCSDSLRENHDIYNDWTQAVVDTIRATGGNNAERILILASPVKTAEKINLTEESIYKRYKNDDRVAYICIWPKQNDLK